MRYQANSGIGGKPSRTRERQLSSGDGVADSEVAKRNLCQSPDVSKHFEIGPKSRVKQAHVDLGNIQHQPVPPFGRLPKIEKYHDAAIRQISDPYQARA